MMRYALSWNAPSAQTALRFVSEQQQEDRFVSEQQQEDRFVSEQKQDDVAREAELDVLRRRQLLEGVLEGVSGGEFGDEFSSALILLDEHAETLLGDDSELIEKTLTALEKLLVMPWEEGVSGIDSSNGVPRSFLSSGDAVGSRKAHVIVTYTSLLIQTNCIEKDPGRLENFVDYLFEVIAAVNDSRTRILRFYACQSLAELESFHPLLLSPLLGPEWQEFQPQQEEESVAWSASADCNLLTFVDEERLHIAEGYSRLFLVCIKNFTVEVQTGLEAAQEMGTDGMCLYGDVQILLLSTKKLVTSFIFFKTKVLLRMRGSRNGASFNQTGTQTLRYT